MIMQHIWSGVAHPSVGSFTARNSSQGLSKLGKCQEPMIEAAHLALSWISVTSITWQQESLNIDSYLTEVVL